MSTVPRRSPHAENSNGHHNLPGQNHRNDCAAEDPSLVAVWAQDDALREEMRRLAAENQDLMSSSGLALGSAHVAANAAEAEARASAAHLEGEALKDQNARLRVRIAELEHVSAASAQQAEEFWAEQQREYEALLEEKSEVIRALHLKIQQMNEALESAPAPKAQQSHEPMPDGKDELLALKEEIEEERAQLKQDEESLMQQMRQMEMAMSRERVELARQRSELQRLHSDFQHELELASRDATLRDRLAGLQRRHQEVVNQKGAAPSSVANRPLSTPSISQPTPLTTPATKKHNSGLLRRLFGSGG